MSQMTQKEVDDVLELLEDAVIRTTITEVLKDKLCLISCGNCQSSSTFNGEDTECSGCILNWSISDGCCDAIASEVIRRLRK